jgi:glycine/D-amino acid oxidase-like deaminating enzyme
VSDTFAPLWLDTAPPLPTHPRIAGPGAALQEERLDVAVIGAGVVGLSTALHLARRGVRVAILERLEPGQGTTGRANGQIIAGLQLSPAAIRAGYGNERGERIIEFAGSAPDRLFELIEREGIDCDAQRSGWIQATRSPRRMKHLERLASAWAQRGTPMRLLDREAVAAAFGTRAFAGGWLDARGGTLQPLAYARGLALACARAGAMIHCGIEARSIDREGAAGWRIATDAGALRANAVVLATNVLTRALGGIGRACIGRSYLSAYSVQLATEPLHPQRHRSILPLQQAGSTLEHLRLRYFRLDRDRRLVIGGPGWLRPPRSPHAPSFRILEASTRRLFPQLADVRFTHRWHARDTITPDLVPHLYEPAPGLLSALGGNGRGLAIGTALGSVLARRLLGEAAEALPYPTTPASSLPLNLPEALRFYLRLGISRFTHAN